MPFFAKLTLAVVIMVAGLVDTTYAQAAAADYLGAWKQVASSAGRCDRCEVSFSGSSSLLDVQSNNGWAAQLEFVGSGQRAKLEGDGGWSSSLNGNLRGERFEAIFQLVGDELHLVMTR